MGSCGSVVGRRRLNIVWSVCGWVGVCVSRGRYYNREPGSSGARFAMVGGRGASSSCWGGTWRMHWIQPHLTSVHLDRWTAWRTTASDPAARETSIDISVGVQDIFDSKTEQDNKTEMGGQKNYLGCVCF